MNVKGFVSMLERYQNALERENSDSATARAMRAELARAAGKSAAEAPYAVKYLQAFLGDDFNTREIDTLLLVASTWAIHQKHRKGKQPHDLDVGAAYRNLVHARLGAYPSSDDPGASLCKRFEAMLSADRSEVGEHLRHFAKMAHAAKDDGTALDYSGLTYDLLLWDAEPNAHGSTVQLRWAQHFWRGGDTTQSKSNKDD